jgi:hypothetical protein
MTSVVIIPPTTKLGAVLLTRISVRLFNFAVDTVVWLMVGFLFCDVIGKKCL